MKADHDMPKVVSQETATAKPRMTQAQRAKQDWEPMPTFSGTSRGMGAATKGGKFTKNG